jgi:hypothetical protein
MSSEHGAGGPAGTDRRVSRGQVVTWEGVEYRVLRRRPVNGLAMLQTDSHEVYLASLDGGIDAEWVPQGEVNPVVAEGTGGTP